MLERSMFDVLEKKETKNSLVEILQFKELRGSSNVKTAENLFYVNQAGMNLKMIRITLSNSYIRVEPGALYYMKGNLQIKASTGGGLIKGLKRKMLSGETFFVNEIHGTGEIYLEPTFGHFFLYDISKNDKAIIVDKGIFYAGTSGLNITASMQKNFSSAMFGGEGLFQSEIEGVGVAILYSPVPMNEIQIIQLNNEKLYVDGNFALMRTLGVSFKVEKSSKTWVSTSVSGEGLLQTFEGTGTVWIAPTQGIYEKMASSEGINFLSNVLGSSNTNTKSTK